MKVVRSATPGIVARRLLDQILRCERGKSRVAFGLTSIRLYVAAACQYSARLSGTAQWSPSTLAPVRRMGVSRRPRNRRRFVRSPEASAVSVGPRDESTGCTRARLFRPQIHSVIGGILTDQIDFANAFSHQCANLGKNRIRCAAPMLAAHLRDHTKCAWMVTPLGDLQVGGMRRRKAEPRRVVIRDVGRTAC